MSHSARLSLGKESYRIEFMFYGVIVAVRAYTSWDTAMGELKKAGASFPPGRGKHEGERTMKHKTNGKYKMHWPVETGEMKTILISKPNEWFWKGIK